MRVFSILRPPPPPRRLQDAPKGTPRALYTSPFLAHLPPARPSWLTAPYLEHRRPEQELPENGTHAPGVNPRAVRLFT